jgi:hypothetical protein
MSTEKGGGGWRLATSGAEGGDRVLGGGTRGSGWVGACAAAASGWCASLLQGGLWLSLLLPSARTSRRKLSQ